MLTGTEADVDAKLGIQLEGEEEENEGVDTVMEVGGSCVESEA